MEQVGGRGRDGCVCGRVRGGRILWGREEVVRQHETTGALIEVRSSRRARLVDPPAFHCALITLQPRSNTSKWLYLWF